MGFEIVRRKSKKLTFIKERLARISHSKAIPIIDLTPRDFRVEVGVSSIAPLTYVYKLPVVTKVIIPLLKVCSVSANPPAESF